MDQTGEWRSRVESITRRRELIGFKLGGKTLYDSLRDLFDSAAYKDARAKMEQGNLTDYSSYLAIDMVKKRIEQYAKAAHQKMLEEFPQLRDEITGEKIKRQRNRFGVEAEAQSASVGPWSYCSPSDQGPIARRAAEEN